MNGDPVSPRSLRGLDWLNFFVADVQTGFGPFIAIYLTTQHWTDLAIGGVLSLGTIVAMASQLPAGALVDWMPSKRLAAALAIGAITGSALLFVLMPSHFGIGLAEILHGFASCMLNPAIAAVSISLVSVAALGERLGRNARFASIGNGVAAAVMGGFGYYFAPGSVFWLTAALGVPSLLALSRIESRRVVRDAAERRRPHGGTWAELRALFLDRRLLAFMACIVLFQMADAAMLPFVGSEIAGKAGSVANLVIAACIVWPQMVVAAISPWVGRAAQRHGRRRLLLLGFAAEPLRGLLFGLTGSPVPVVLIQGLDGISAAVIGVLLPLIAADIARERGHFNLTMGAIGLAVGLGATVSSGAAGAIANGVGVRAAFFALAGAGLLATVAVWFLMPETVTDQESTTT
ncbi:MFS transporter [Acidiphilium sp. AL]|uniref:MFS transporter n=1 Tax=Acidiphilium iwatense TaxID=768198 RepID=A0ABS9DQR9_9PROT|nr:MULTISPECIES: MFS transporter [Acidiphilium]MCF3945088.1 MFS transporter [Acidiphilium iwatense]MCU4160567.1 MFS transporter [Acidiphilium sp. AL]